MRIAFPIAALALLIAAPAAAQRANTVAEALEAIRAKPSAPTDAAAPPVPTTNPGRWVRTEDYPAWAASYQVNGTVGFVLDVDASGRVTGCTVSESSGVADLDRVACEKVTERAQFRPARDAQGNPVASQWQNRVRWETPEPAAVRVPEPGELVVSMIVEPDGSVSKCTVERATGLAAQAADGALCADTGPYQPLLDDDGKPQRRRIRLVTSIEHQPLP